jgi:hypothetical protein
VGRWRLDEGVGTLAADSSGLGHHAALVNGATWASRVGISDWCVAFDGVDDYMNIGDPSAGTLDFGFGSFSYGMWVYVYDDRGPWDMAWYKGGSSANDPGYDMELGSGNWAAYVSDGTTIRSVAMNSGVYGQWVHLFVVVDRLAKRMFLYANGALQSSTDITLLTGSVSTSNEAWIGSPGYPLHARIDEVRVYSRALNTGEVASLASSVTSDYDGDGIPDSSEDRNGNGVQDGGETDWQSTTQGPPGSHGLEVFTPLR